MASHKRGGGFDHYGNSSFHAGKRARPYSQGKPQQRSGPAQLELCSTDMHSGLVALLDRFVASETTPSADKEILHHACELRRLLDHRLHPSSAAIKQELDQKRPDRSTSIVVPSYIHRKVQEAKDLPPLPPIAQPHLHEAVFTHQSVHATTHSVHEAVNLGLDYERFEFLGDAYIELIASRALYNRFPHVDIPQLSSWRERLVENSALGKFSEAYGFPDRLKAKMHWDKDSKAWKKVVADLFEAYVAGVVLDDPEHGFETAEKWLDTLWAPQLLSFKEKVVENARAKDDLQKLIFVNHIKLEYREEKPMTYTNGVQMFYIGVRLTGWGYENEWLGSGEGQNKAQAAIAAANDAMKRNSKVLVDATRQKSELMEIRAKERAEKAQNETQTQGEDSMNATARHGDGQHHPKHDEDHDKGKKNKKERKRKSATDENAA